ncbi:GGDEF domain-containing protein [Stakelama saccharophila]|uniref:diguanylate cyclase n=1 Tax=Stakelama saccharophila TaxID=3075605 RepID=A0ABZ0BCW5_9SPHN|nr:GGDEF domain-containing protein [Stakelama sp. W311]WNO54129.1 GGDEF domain-containing protein [Stakelama sp. W311]
MLADRADVDDPERMQPTMRLYDRVGQFLRDQRLEPTPVNYSFAYHVLAHPDGPLARAVMRLTDGGVRLTRRDIDSLEADVDTAAATNSAAHAQNLVARTQVQVDGFEDLMHRMRAETRGFGRDLAASNAELQNRAGEHPILHDVVQITAGMLDRVHHAESRLEEATRETRDLRALLEEARDDAKRDPLTGLPNRRAFEEAMTEAVAAGRAMAVAIIDVDHFKAINDRFGHDIGDRVLRAIAGELATACGDHLVTRYGGEEFAILFLDVEQTAAEATLFRAKEAVSAKRYRVRENDLPVGEITVSAGLTRAEPGEAWAETFRRADRLLYSAKTNGRNRVLHG